MDFPTCLTKMKAPGTPRPGIFRQGVIQVMMTRACDQSCFACTQGSNLGGKPVMMTPDQAEEAFASLKRYFGVVGAFGGNPSLKKGTRVYTAKGIYPIDELENEIFQVRNLHGQLSTAICRLSGKDKPLYRITLRGGHHYYATAEHEWPALKLAFGSNPKRKELPNYVPHKQAFPLGKVMTCDLKPGMRLPIVKTDTLGYGHFGNREDGFLAGWLLGDGWLGEKHRPKLKKMKSRNQYVLFQREYMSRRVRHIGMIVNNADKESGIASILEQKIRSFGSEANFRAVKQCYEISVAHPNVETWMDEFGITSKADGLPLATWTTASEGFRIGLLDGLFSSDGDVDIHNGYARVRLTTVHKKMAQDVSDLLGFYGIKTAILFRTRPPTQFKGRKPNTQTCSYYSVSIDGTASVEHFTKLITLTHKNKRERLQAAFGRHKKDIESENIEIKSIELTELREDVWDISVADDTHCFQLAHCITGNCMHPQFEEICKRMQKHIPFEQRGLWSNHPRSKGKIIRETFNPAVSNLNVHLSKEAYDEFARDWPECRPYLKGLETDSRHSPPFVAMKDLNIPEGEMWELVSRCRINQEWSSIVCVFRGQLRGFFCEIAGAQSMLHETDPHYPDTGCKIVPGWWRKGMTEFTEQVAKHCPECGIPMQGYGSLAVNGDKEQVSQTHMGIYKPKVKGRRVELVTVREQLDEGKINRCTDYIGNGSL